MSNGTLRKGLTLEDIPDTDHFPYVLEEGETIQEPLPFTLNQGPFELANTFLATTADREKPLAPGSFPGASIDVFDTVKRLRKSKNAGIAYDTQVLEYTARTLQFFASSGYFVYDTGNRDPENPQDRYEYVKIKHHEQFENAVQVFEQWASFKETQLNDASLGRQLQANQVQYNLAPSVHDQTRQQAALDVERRALLRLAGRGGFRRGGRGGRGGQRGGRGAARQERSITEA